MKGKEEILDTQLHCTVDDSNITNITCLSNRRVLLFSSKGEIFELKYNTPVR